ncbi:MAG: hypothetical protein PWP23_3023 [Candidatus Sumerlaeota bacterium]|nr:hypothetical protein [Candidatus Sumerlaeota bacterium]
MRLSGTVWGILAVALVVFVGSTTPARGTVTFAGASFTVNTTTGVNNQHPRVAMDSDGNYIVVWHRDGKEIVARKYNASGTPLTGEIVVSATSSILDKYYPDIAIADNGDWMVIWYQYANGAASGTYWRIYGKAYYANNTVKRSDFSISPSYPSTNSRPSIAADGAGNYVVAYADGPSNTIVAQRLNASAQLVGLPITCNTNFKGALADTSVAMAPDGRFVVVWARSHTLYSISGQRFEADGTPIGSEFSAISVATYTGQPRSPHVAMNASGEFVVTALSGTDQRSVSLAKYNAEGVRIYYLLSAANNGSNEVLDPRVAISSAGDYILTWQTYISSTSSLRGNWFRHFSATSSNNSGYQRMNDERSRLGSTGNVVAMTPDGTKGVAVWYLLDDVHAEHFSLSSGVHFASSSDSIDENDAAGMIPVRMERSNGTGALDVTVTVKSSTATGGSSAGGGNDFDNSIFPVTVSFADTETEAEFNLPVFDDSDLEGNETITLEFSVPSGQLIGSNTETTVTILDDETPTVKFADTIFYYDEDGPYATSPVTLQRNGSALGFSTQVRLTLTNGTATGGATQTAGKDFDNSVFPMIVTFDPGETELIVPLTLWDDAVIESPEEDFYLNIETIDPANIGSPSTGRVVLLDDDREYHLTVSPSTTLTEGNSGTSNVVFTINRLGYPSAYSNVKYTLGGTAVKGVDYDEEVVTGTNIAGGGGIINFNPNSTQATITVPVFGNLMDNPDRTLSLTLSEPFPPEFVRIVAPESRQITILDNDPTPVVFFTASNTNVDEGPSRIIDDLKLRRSTNLNNTTVVQVAVQAKGSGTDATTDFKGSDFPMLVTFLPGEDLKTVPVEIFDDAEYETGDYVRFVVTPTDSLATTTSPSTSTINLIDDDSYIRIFSGITSFSEKDSGVTNLTLQVIRDGTHKGIATVDIAFGGTAVLGEDYTLTAEPGTGVTVDGSTITFGDGAFRCNYQVGLIGDRFDEADETVIATLSNPQPASTTVFGATTEWTLTFIDDDTAENDPPDVVASAEGAVPNGETGFVLSSSMFGVDDVDSPLSALKVTVTTAPTLGELRRASKAVVALGVGDSFTLAEADQGTISYHFFGATSVSAQDTFAFTIEDEGAVPSAPITFTIDVPAGTRVGEWNLY